MNRLDINHIPQIIYDKVSTGPTIIYFGVGSEFDPKEPNSINTENNNQNQIKISPWEPSKNQQFPLFLQNFKYRNPDVNILIILIDMVMSERPFVVRENERFYSGDWKNYPYSNVFQSEQNNITVCTFRETLSYTDNNNYNPISMLVQSIQLVLVHDSLLFYHDFSGINSYIVDNLVRKNLQGVSLEDYRNKICIDISRGLEGNCFPSMDSPHLYPVLKREGSLIHVDPRNLSPIEKTRLYQKTCTDIMSDDYKVELFCEENVDLILFEQLKYLNQVEIYRISNAIFPIIRQLPNLDDKPLPKFEYAIGFLDSLSSDYPEIMDQYLNIKRLIGNSKDSQELVEIKIKLKELAYDIIEIFMNTISRDYGISNDTIYELYNKLKTHPNLYQLSTIYKDFFKSKGLI